MSDPNTTFVVGATGATGKWVVKLLLDMDQHVKVVVRSKQRMVELLKEIDCTAYDDDRLTIIEGSLVEDFTNKELETHIQDCSTVICCLGHNLTFKGMYGAPRKLVTLASERLTNALLAVAKDENGTKSPKKYIHMGSDGVANPNGEDDPRNACESSVLCLLRCLVPPHVDNEQAAQHVHSLGTTSTKLEWCIVRPTDLINGNPSADEEKYVLYKKPVGGLFGAGTATRSHVASCMVDLTLNDKIWNEWKFQMPVIHDNNEATSVDSDAATKKKIS